MDGDPEPELVRPERVALLESEDVGADVVHGARVVGRVGIVRDEQVVLAEHPLGHEPEEHAHLGACHAPSDGSDGTAGHPVGDARGEGMEHATHRRDVGVHPLRSIEHAGRSCAGRVQTGEVSDQLLGAGGDRREVRVQRFTEV